MRRPLLRSRLEAQPSRQASINVSVLAEARCPTSPTSPAPSLCVHPEVSQASALLPAGAAGPQQPERDRSTPHLCRSQGGNKAGPSQGTPLRGDKHGVAEAGDSQVAKGRTLEPHPKFVWRVRRSRPPPCPDGRGGPRGTSGSWVETAVLPSPAGARAAGAKGCSRALQHDKQVASQTPGGSRGTQRPWQEACRARAHPTVSPLTRLQPDLQNACLGGSLTPPPPPLSLTGMEPPSWPGLCPPRALTPPSRTPRLPRAPLLAHGAQGGQARDSRGRTACTQMCGPRRPRLLWAWSPHLSHGQ